MKPKLTEELIEVMCGLKAKGMHNKDICMVVGIHEATLYRWLNKPSGTYRFMPAVRMDRTRGVPVPSGPFLS